MCCSHTQTVICTSYNNCCDSQTAAVRQHQPLCRFFLFFFFCLLLKFRARSAAANTSCLLGQEAWETQSRQQPRPRGGKEVPPERGAGCYRRGLCISIHNCQKTSTPVSYSVACLDQSSHIISAGRAEETNTSKVFSDTGQLFDAKCLQWPGRVLGSLPLQQ